jgi:hypothetical protein
MYGLDDVRELAFNDTCLSRLTEHPLGIEPPHPEPGAEQWGFINRLEWPSSEGRAASMEQANI